MLKTSKYISAHKRYHTLDALRFFAFLKVFLLHLPQGINAPIFNFMKDGGGTGVALFFVLSGFLISDILLKEYEKEGRVKAGKFFLRRALRIWPLYFLGVGLAYLGIYISQTLGVSQTEGYMPNPVFSLTFLENYKMIWEGTHPRGLPLHVFWSLCIEEHFYLLWLLLFAVIRPRNWVKTFLILWASGWVARFVFANELPNYAINGGEILSSLDYFSIGGLIAVVIRNPKIRVSLIHKISISIVALVFMLFQHTFYLQLGIAGIGITAMVYGLLIFAFVAPGAEQFRINDRSIWSYLGRISYGLYVFHTAVIMVMIKLCEHFGIVYQQGFMLIVFSLLALGFSVIISHISFRYYEGWFLKWRERTLLD